MSDTIMAIRVFKGESTTDIMATDCKFMYEDIKAVIPHKVYQEYGDEYKIINIPGIFYMLDASKYPLPIVEMPIFVPMTAVIQIAYELPF